MSGCPDLCTAAKCAELEAKIDELESRLITLESEFIFHTDLPVSNAHEIDLNITGLIQYDAVANSIGLDIYLVDTNSNLLAEGNIQSLPTPFVPEWDFNAHKNTAIPDAHAYIPEVLLDVFTPTDNEYIIKILIDGVSAEDSLIINYEPEIELNAYPENDDIRLVLSLDSRDVSTLITLPETDLDIDRKIDEYFNSLNFYFTIDYIGSNDYKFTITLGNKARSQVLDLPYFGGGGGSGEIPPTTVSLFGNYDEANNNLDITAVVDGISATTTIDLDAMPFDEILTKLREIIEKLAELEPAETVAIVASEKELHRVKDKVLILHFVTLDNYPKRAKNSSYRPIQIPAPLAEYSWETDFENLRWQQGNQYAEMKLEGWKTRVSGWFADETEANSYFDAILNLTTAVEENRIFPKHSNSKTNIANRTTRPYRAFVTRVGQNGESICEAKYQPPAESNE